ncbi:phage major capsid protein, P2 family [Ostreibacterium oceani]|uniref:Phage major capsid protein, P2 family n=1 Tax=Ostreibacterium oceani TaxID=2654998 RepID=A0A6N7F4V6_9GAMM|nr:phage major capsid protein, P2 family [Ostreibacterium oceani]MPV86916.1 phage major capsid protein, P2 family [Ostreibacterium oceani]
MKNETRDKLEQYFTTQASLNSISIDTVRGGHKFIAAPSVEQTLEKRIQESDGFLRSINIFGVDEMEGETIGLGVGSTIASRTDTESAERETRDVHSLNAARYYCRQTNFDTHVRYALLDQWAKFPDFEDKLTASIVTRIGLDRIMIGFHGTNAANNTDRVANPLLQDVNTGWIQKYRNDAPDKVMSDGAAAGSITIGETGDYKNLHALALDIRNNALDVWHRNAAGLCVIMGRDLQADDTMRLVNQAHSPSESLALAKIRQTGVIDGLPVIDVPHFPDGTMMLTTLANLSIYTQNGGKRRHFADNPRRDRLETYTSSNDAYAIEDYGLGGIAENVSFI